MRNPFTRSTWLAKNFEESTTMPPSADGLAALNRTGKHIYGGTVPKHVKARRRAKNKVARASRRANR